MTAAAVRLGARKRRATLTPAIPSFLMASLMIGCSGQASLSPPGVGSRPKSGQAAVSSPAEAQRETQTHLTMKMGNVSLQPVTPEEFKKIIAAHKGKVVLVDFWATYCGPCREKFPQTLALAKKYAPQGLTVVSMSMDSPEPRDQEKALHFLEEQHAQIINLANRLEDSDAAFGAFDIDGGALPHYKIFDRKGTPHWKFGGDPDHPFNEKDIERAVMAALKEK